MLTIRGILHPTDFSELSDHAFRLACKLAEDYHAPLHILHVATAFEAYKAEEPYAQHPAQYLAQDWKKLERYEAPGVEIHHLLEEGDPVEQILHVAKSLPIDLIVLGSHGRTGLERLLLGSVAEHVLRGATCWVLVVKGPVAINEVAVGAGTETTSSK